MAKENLERQHEDCIEFEECLELRTNLPAVLNQRNRFMPIATLASSFEPCVFHYKGSFIALDEANIPCSFLSISNQPP